MRKKLLAFNITAPFGHFKVIYATTSALTYPIPSKTAIYGLVGNIIGLTNEKNEYLNSFTEGACKIALQVLKPISTQRFHINWSTTPGPIKNRKPTLVEHISNPAFRIYFTHDDKNLYEKLKKHLENHTSVYTPCMGLANLLANFEFKGEYEYDNVFDKVADIHSVIPFTCFENFDDNESFARENFITQMSQYTMEMNSQRDVTKREEVLLDRKGLPIRAKIKMFQTLKNNQESINIILH